MIQDGYLNHAVQEIFAVNQLVYASQFAKAKNKNSTKTTIRNYVLYVMATSNQNKMTLQDILRGVNALRSQSIGQQSLSPALTKLKSEALNVLTGSRNSWQFVDPMFKAYVREHKNELILK